MDSRTAHHVLSRIASYLELRGESTFKVRAYENAAQQMRALGVDDLAPLYRSGELGRLRGLGPATLAVIRDLIETGESSYLEELRQSMPEGLVEMLEVPSLTPARIHAIHQTLNITTIEELEAAARDGRLAKVPKLGARTAEKILQGIALARERKSRRLYYHAAIEARSVVEAVRSHPMVERAEIAGTIRRRVEIAELIEVVAACRESPVDVARTFTRIAGMRSATGTGADVSLVFVDGVRLELHCVEPNRFGVAWWRATGSDAHVAEVTARLAANGFSVDDNTLRDASGAIVDAPEEDVVYRAAGLPFIEPELREGLGDVDAAARGELPNLITSADIRGVLHCHTLYSDGKATIAEMARAAQERGWSYIGITDHSQAAGFAGGMSAEKLLAQHEEIDALNAASTGFRILKGIEADILVDGRIDGADEWLDRFDFVVASIHSRFAMEGPKMTERVLRALDDPRVTVLGHPTGRLLLSREPYALDLDAVLEKAAEVGAAVELNADPHRLDLDWRYLRTARALGIPVEIGPDAHSTHGLDYTELGIGIARKGWLGAADVLNTRSADDVLAFAAARRNRH